MEGLILPLQKGRKRKVNHALQIKVTKQPRESGVVAFRNIAIRERLLRLLLGNKAKLTVIVPGDSVSELAIQEIGGETAHETV